jgi:flagellar motor protein MotB
VTPNPTIPEVNGGVIAMTDAGADFVIGVGGGSDVVQVDASGSARYNEGLSEQRAQSVTTFLTSSGVDPARIKAIGMGEDRLLVPTPPQTPEPRNRRVQVINLGA